MTWIYRQLFHDPQADGSGTDTLLTHLVSPVVAELTERLRTAETLIKVR